MDGPGGIGRLLIILGLSLAALGVVLTLGAKISWLGRLPGDIYINKDNFGFYFPITTGIIISISFDMLRTSC